MIRQVCNCDGQDGRSHCGYCSSHNRVQSPDVCCRLYNLFPVFTCYVCLRVISYSRRLHHDHADSCECHVIIYCLLFTSAWLTPLGPYDIEYSVPDIHIVIDIVDSLLVLWQLSVTVSQSQESSCVLSNYFHHVLLCIFAFYIDHSVGRSDQFFFYIVLIF